MNNPVQTQQAQSAAEEKSDTTGTPNTPANASGKSTSTTAKSNRKTPASEFRATATDDMIREMVGDATGLNGATRLNDDDFKKKWGFAPSTNLSFADERGFYHMNHRDTKKSSSNDAPSIPPDANGHKRLIISRIGPEPEEKSSQTFQLYPDIKKRLEAVYKIEWQCSHRAIQNQLLSEALDKYGY